MEQLFSNLISLMSSVPLPLVFLIVAVWVGAESAGIGVPIEPMMLFAGSLAAQSKNPIVEVAFFIVCTALGCLVFASIAYEIGKRVGTTAITKVGRFIGLNKTRADHIELWLRHRGGLGVFIARETPMVRTFGSYMMGAADIPPTTFALSTFGGSLVYCGIWIVLGNILGANYTQALGYLGKIGTPGILIAVGVVLAVMVLHHFAGRFGFHRIKRHYLRHGPKPLAASASASTGA
ncbi:MAG TPA: DedA family protein [Ktedonobacterales bacterium]|nr:DedA family protein [Ktedonobacterales bacterium]